MAAGVLVGIWAQFSGSLGVIMWVAFVSWTCCFSAGGGVAGLTRTVDANISGVIYGWLMVLVVVWLMFNGALGLSVAVFTLAICLQAAWRALSFIRGTIRRGGLLRRHRRSRPHRADIAGYRIRRRRQAAAEAHLTRARSGTYCRDRELMFSGSD
ncbi:DUF1097 domain-containing protein [Paenarthrobacter sp. NPDC091669]|uniref:DUF1097 domain-containing protein n=1 Tax=Paenarthrobacter sp. NPDC091669 TaxID=3364384 RepID=UPI003814747A